MKVNADEVKQLAEPLMRYLADNCPPYAVVVRAGRVEVVETLLTSAEYESSERR